MGLGAAPDVHGSSPAATRKLAGLLADAGVITLTLGNLTMLKSPAAHHALFHLSCTVVNSTHNFSNYFQYAHVPPKRSTENQPQTFLNKYETEYSPLLEHQSSQPFFYPKESPYPCSTNCILGSVCFVVKYFPEDIFRFVGICFTVKWWSNGK